MCTITRINRDAVPKSISIEFERDASLRGTEVVIINDGPKGEHGVKLVCYDNGEIQVSGVAELKYRTDIV